MTTVASASSTERAALPVVRARLHPGQQRAFDSSAKVVMVLAGTGGGKTAFGPLWLLERRRRHGPGSSFLVVAPHKILVRTTMPAVLNLFEVKLRLGEWQNKNEGIWRFRDGGYIYFASADTPESIEGAHVHAAWMDECGQRQFPEAAWHAVQRRVRFHAGDILGTTTPYVLGWLKELWDAWRRGERPDVEFISFPSIANPRYPREEFERARRTLPEWQFRMFHLGEWDRPAGLVYADVTDAHWVASLPLGADAWDAYAGLDFGYNNPTAIVYAVLSPDDVLYVYDCYYESGRTDADNARLAPRPPRLRQAWGDPSSPEAIEEFRRAGWPVSPSERHEVRDGILAVIERLRTGRLRFVRGPAMADLQRELDSYVWDERQPDRPVKLNDHLMDALRYLCWGVRRPLVVWSL